MIVCGLFIHISITIFLRQIERCPAGAVILSLEATGSMMIMMSLFVGVKRLFVTVTDISRPCQPEKLIPLLP